MLVYQNLHAVLEGHYSKYSPDDSELPRGVSADVKLTGSISDTETVFSFTVGGGVHIPINASIGVAIDARYSHATTEGEATKWMPITASIVFSL